MEIGLVGTGPMGLGIGKSLLRELAPQGHGITVYNRTAAKAAPLVEAGARLAKTPAAAAGGDVEIAKAIPAEAGRSARRRRGHGHGRSGSERS